jgi:hypothetical protein
MEIPQADRREFAANSTRWRVRCEKKDEVWRLARASSLPLKNAIDTKDTKRHKVTFCGEGHDTEHHTPSKRGGFCVLCACVYVRHAVQTKGSQIEIFWAATKASDARLRAVRFALTSSDALIPIRNAYVRHCSIVIALIPFGM